MEKIASEKIYMDMTAENDVCKVVSQGDGKFKLYIFDRNEYIPVNVDMSFLDSVRIFSSFYQIKETVKNKEVISAINRDIKIKTALHKANEVFRRGYSEAIKKYRNDEIFYRILDVRSRCDDLRFTADDELCRRNSELVASNLEKSIESKTVIPVNMDELKATEKKYRARIEAEGILP